VTDNTSEPESISPALALDWVYSRWGREDQRGKGNLMTAQKVLEAVRLVRTRKIRQPRHAYDERMPLAPLTPLPLH
jgi:hypothetical protein